MVKVSECSFMISAGAFLAATACRTDNSEDNIRPNILIAISDDQSYCKRPEYELYDIRYDPYCLITPAGAKESEAVDKEMREALHAELVRSGDPRVTGPDKEVFNSYPSFSPVRQFPIPN